jgi:hypothetical protein
MRIDLYDPRVGQAIQYVKESHKTSNAKELEDTFEKVYHCKIISNDDPFCTEGYLEITEEKYQTWFLVQFGGEANE